MSGAADYQITVVARDIEDYERVHNTQLSRLPHVARIESSFALREVINREVPPEILAGGLMDRDAPRADLRSAPTRLSSW